MKKRIIVFEEISNRHLFLIKYYLWRSNRIYCLRVKSKDKWLEGLIQDNKIIKINLKLDVSMYNGEYHDLAFDNTDRVFQEIFGKNRIIQKMTELYDSQEVELVYKKNLCQRLSRICYINLMLSKLEEQFPDTKIAFIPSDDMELYRTLGEDIYNYNWYLKIFQKVGADFYPHPNSSIIWWKKMKEISLKFSNLFRYFQAGWFYVEKIRAKAEQKKVIKRYDYGVTIVSPLREFANKIRKVDFLLNGKGIRKENTLFINCSELNEEQIAYLKKNNLNYLNFRGNWDSASIRKALPVWFSLLPELIMEREEVIVPTIELLSNYIKWDTFRRKIILKHLITYCDFSSSAVARNILLRQNDTKTWYYMDTINSGRFFRPENKDYLYRHSIFGYLNYDNFISWSPMASEYFKSHNQQIRNYIEVGCLWAEHLRLIKGGIETEFRNILDKNGYTDKFKLVAVFDSTYHNDSVTTYNDGVAFAEGIKRLLEDFKEIYIVFKEKKPRWVHKELWVHKQEGAEELIAIYERLSAHPRCYLPLNKLCPSEIVVFSDLTISFPFTSTTFEALAGRGRAIFYDATNKFRGTYYDKVPGLVCHNYEELKKRVDSLLYDISDDAYNDYLDTYIKGDLEPYLDGRAITRFRELLTKG